MDPFQDMMPSPLSASPSSGSNDDGKEAVITAVIVTCSLSIVGSLSIIIAFLLSRDFRRSQSRRLLFNLAICDLVTAIAYLIRPTSHQLCKAQSVINIFGNEASFFWTDFIALFLFLSRKYGIKRASKCVPLFHVISWGWPVLSVILVAFNHAWGNDDGHATAYWCWIRGDIKDKTMWHLIGGKGVEWTSCIFITLMYILVFIDLRKHVDQSPATQLLISQRAGVNSWKTTEKKLLAIPFIFIVLRTPGTIRTIYEMSHSSSLDYEWLKILQAVGDSGQGIANGILFGLFTEKVRSFYRKLISRCTHRDNNNHHTHSSRNFYGTLTKAGTSEYHNNHNSYPVNNDNYKYSYT